MALNPQPGPAHVSSHSPQGRTRSASHVSSSWGGLSSMLRPAASERRTAAARLGWWADLARVLRAAGTNPQSRPLYAVLAVGDLSSDDPRRPR